MPNGLPATVDQLKPGVHYRLGTRRPYRPAPADFRETFLRLGWDAEIMEIYRCGWPRIMRWIDECGGDELRQARAARSGYMPAPRRQSSLPTYAQAVAGITCGQAAPE